MKGTLVKAHIMSKPMVDLAKDCIFLYRNLNCMRHAAAISYFALLSFLPFIIIILSIIGFLVAAMGNETESTAEFLNGIIGPAQHIAPFVRQELIDQLVNIVHVRATTGVLGFVAMVFSGSLVFGALETALNSIFMVPRNRHFVVSKLVFLGFIGSLVLFMLVGHYALALINSWLAAADREPIQDIVYSSRVVGVLLSFIGTVAVFVALIRYFCRMSIPLKDILAGAVLFFMLFELAKQGFLYFLESFAQFDVVYGSLSAAMVLIIWVFYTVAIFLFSAVVVRVLVERGWLGPHLQTKLHWYPIRQTDPSQANPIDPSEEPQTQDPRLLPVINDDTPPQEQPKDPQEVSK